MTQLSAMSPAALVKQLRQGCDINSGDVETQRHYEKWLSRDSWQLESEALPLLVGIAPQDYAAYLHQIKAAEASAELLQALCASLQLEPAATITPQQLQHWCRQHKIALPQAMSNLLDFINRVITPVNAGSSTPEEQHAAHQEREVILGAALSLVTKFPEQCRDEHGFFDGLKIADLLRQKALLWFPLGPPQLSREEIATLLEKYLT